MSQYRQNSLKEEVGESIYARLNGEAEKEVARALQMPLIDQHRKEQYYRPRYLLSDLITECELFKEIGLKFSPLDVVSILFGSKLLFAVKNKKEFDQRFGGGFIFSESEFVFVWEERANGIDAVISDHLERLDNTITEKTLITEISHFNTHSGDPKKFLENLFIKLDLPFVCFFDDDTLIKKHKELEPGLKDHTLSGAKSFFCSPSIGFTSIGSSRYVYLYASAFMRTFLNLLRIAGFMYKPQMDFGQSNVEFTAPKAPVILGTHSSGCFCWEEDTKKPWEKIPDGCLFQSFGYRGLSKMWLDERSFGGMEKFFLENKIVLDRLENPWTAQNINDVIPSVDILSSVTQIPDLGAKILLIYCCLEHLFVPKNISKDNTKYIIGGINAIRPGLLPWFKRLYGMRCDYAHKGFIQKIDEARKLIFESIGNTMSLLAAKLKQSS
jgi:hypothetical protein